MTNASPRTLARNAPSDSPVPQPRRDWLLRRVIDRLASEGEFRLSEIEAEYTRQLALCVRAA